MSGVVFVKMFGAVQMSKEALRNMRGTAFGSKAVFEPGTGIWHLNLALAAWT